MCGRLEADEAGRRRFEPEIVGAVVDRLDVFLQAIDFVAVAERLVVFGAEGGAAGAQLRDFVGDAGAGEARFVDARLRFGDFLALLGVATLAEHRAYRRERRRVGLRNLFIDIFDLALECGAARMIAAEALQLDGGGFALGGELRVGAGDVVIVRQHLLRGRVDFELADAPLVILQRGQAGLHFYEVATGAVQRRGRVADHLVVRADEAVGEGRDAELAGELALQFAMRVDLIFELRAAGDEQLHALVAAVELLALLTGEIGSDDGVDDVGQSFCIRAFEADRDQVGAGDRIDLERPHQAFCRAVVGLARVLPQRALGAEPAERVGHRERTLDFNDLLLHVVVVVGVGVEARLDVFLQRLGKVRRDAD